MRPMFLEHGGLAPLLLGFLGRLAALAVLLRRDAALEIRLEFRQTLARFRFLRLDRLELGLERFQALARIAFPLLVLAPFFAEDRFSALSLFFERRFLLLSLLCECGFEPLALVLAGSFALLVLLRSSSMMASRRRHSASMMASRRCALCLEDGIALFALFL